MKQLTLLLATAIILVGCNNTTTTNNKENYFPRTEVTKQCIYGLTALKVFYIEESRVYRGGTIYQRTTEDKLIPCNTKTDYLDQKILTLTK